MRQFAAYTEAQNQRGSFWQRVCSRSTFGTMPALQLVYMLLAKDKKVSPEIVDIVRQRVSGIGQTKIAEDCMGQGRRSEKPSCNVQRQPVAKLYQRLIDEHMSDKMYSYNCPDWRSQTLPPGKSNLPASAYKLRIRDSPKLIPEIVSTKQQTPWYSSSPEGQNLVYVDLLLTDLAARTNKWGKVEESCGVAMLFDGEDLCVQPPGENQWYLSLGCVGGVGVLLWPAEAQKERGRLVPLVPKATAEPVLTVAIDASQWKAATCTWTSPMGSFLQRRQPAAQGAKLELRVHGPVRNLLQEAAYQAFWQTTFTSVKWWCKHLGLKAKPNADLMACLVTLIDHLLPGLDDAAKHAILAKRVKHDTVWDEFTNLDGAGDFIDEKDKAEFEKIVNVHKPKSKQPREYKQTLFMMCRESEAAAEKRKAAKRAGSSRGASSSTWRTVDGSPVGGSFPPAGEPTHTEAQVLCPSPVRIYSDSANCRRQAFYPDVGTASRSMRLYGGRQAAMLCLGWAWKEVLWRSGKTADACPIKGLRLSASEPEA